jgi:hypothetical protein
MWTGRTSIHVSRHGSSEPDGSRAAGFDILSSRTCLVSMATERRVLSRALRSAGRRRNARQTRTAVASRLRKTVTYHPPHKRQPVGGRTARPHASGTGRNPPSRCSGDDWRPRGPSGSQAGVDIDVCRAAAVRAGGDDGANAVLSHARRTDRPCETLVLRG